jgi:hypothetical protein
VIFGEKNLLYFEVKSYSKTQVNLVSAVTNIDSPVKIKLFVVFLSKFLQTPLQLQAPETSWVE